MESKACVLYVNGRQEPSDGVAGSRLGKVFAGVGIVVVSGFPAAGKSTLARRLAADLEYVVVSRDRLWDTTGLRAVQHALPADSARLAPAAVDGIISYVVDEVLDAGVGVIIDNNYNWHEQREPVRSQVRRRAEPAVEVCLWGEPAVLKERFARRTPMDQALSATFDRAVERDRVPVLQPPTTVFEFDTTDLAVLDADYPDLLRKVRAEVGALDS